MASVMNFSELVKQRQSDRKYKNDAVPRELLVQCIESARLSPSACNAQPWRFVVVDEAELKNKVADCAASLGMNKFALQAPVIIAVVLEKMNMLSAIGSVIRDKEFSLLDVGIAVNQLCLQAADLGLGTCIVGWFNEKEVKRLLHIPKSKRVPLLITVGFPDAATRDKVRKSLDEMSSWNSY